VRVAAIWIRCDACAGSGLLPDADFNLHKCRCCEGRGQYGLVMPLEVAQRLTASSPLARALRWAAA
jgi:DnaJ-class molecular chaperone